MQSTSPVYLSVVMSTHNDEKYIKQAIDSILEQTYPYFEFIIVNDGSTDNTLKILESYDDERIRIVDKQNTGLANSLNVGIGLAKYDWIARMDADDIALPTRFERQVRCIKDNVAVVGGQRIIINVNGDSIGLDRLPLSSFIIKFFLRCNISMIVHPSAIISKKALNVVGCYDDNFTAAQDKELWFRISREYKMVNTLDVVLKYRKSPNGISIKRRQEQDLYSLLGFVKYVNRCSKILGEREFACFKERVLAHAYTEKIGRLNMLVNKVSLPRRVLIRFRIVMLSYKLAKSIEID